MAMKPVGKAILIGAIAAAGMAGIYFSGALNKLPEPKTETTPQVEVPATPPVKEQIQGIDVPVTNTPSVPPAAPAPAPVDALDQLIKQTGKK